MSLNGQPREEERRLGPILVNSFHSSTIADTKATTLSSILASSALVHLLHSIFVPSPPNLKKKLGRPWDGMVQRLSVPLSLRLRDHRLALDIELVCRHIYLETLSSRFCNLQNTLLRPKGLRRACNAHGPAAHTRLELLHVSDNPRIRSTLAAPFLIFVRLPPHPASLTAATLDFDVTFVVLPRRISARWRTLHRPRCFAIGKCIRTFRCSSFVASAATAKTRPVAYRAVVLLCAEANALPRTGRARGSPTMSCTRLSSRASRN